MLAGGRSRRLGTDKAFVEVEGRWLIGHVLNALVGASQTLIVGGRDPRLPEVAADADAVHVPDRWPGDGPLGAVITALGHARHPVTVILPCDLPGISPADVALLVDTVLVDTVDTIDRAHSQPSPGCHDRAHSQPSPGCHDRAHSQPSPEPKPVVAVFTDRYRHHLPLAITTGAVALAEQQFESGSRSVASLLDRASVIDLPAPPSAVADIDTPADLDRIGDTPADLDRIGYIS